MSYYKVVPTRLMWGKKVSLINQIRLNQELYTPNPLTDLGKQMMLVAMDTIQCTFLLNYVLYVTYISCLYAFYVQCNGL